MPENYEDMPQPAMDANGPALTPAEMRLALAGAIKLIDVPQEMADVGTSGKQRVYFFPDETGVRAACNDPDNYCNDGVVLTNGAGAWGHGSCGGSGCQNGYDRDDLKPGRGWVAATDALIWLTAATKLFPGFIGRWARRWDDYRNQTYKCRGPDDLPPDFFSFLIELATATEGAELGTYA